MVTCNIVLFSALVWACARALHFADVSRRSAEAERVQLRTRSAAEAEQSRTLAFLDAVSSALVGSLEYTTTLQRIAQLAVPTLADGCLVDVLEPRGGLRHVAVAHMDGALEAKARALLEQDADAVQPAGDMAEVLRTGEPLLHAGDPLPPGAPSLVRELGGQCYVVVSLRARGRSLGALTLFSHADRCIANADVGLALELAGRAGFALDNARLYREAQEAVRTREEVLGIVSHDLKNPLGAMRLSAALLAQMAPADEAGARMRKHLATMERSVERMDRLIRDLLDFARLRGGRLALEPHPQDVGRLLNDALTLLEPLAVQKGLQLHIAPTAPGLEVSCDRDRTFQVFSNLVGNAIKFTPEGGRVEVRARGASGWVHFQVRDTGPGIPQSAQPHLFEPYWQAEETAHQGAGLGLYITRGIVEAHGGTLWVESTPGEGATFHFTLPRADAVDLDELQTLDPRTRTLQ
nr:MULTISPECIES: HAMP domain-containing sensor histidine kinase [Myxococcaceae]